jgi:hypothetical protein
MRIVRHHHDSFVKILVEPLEDLQHFGRRMAVEIAVRLVRKQEGWIADDGAGDGDTLFLATRKAA